MNKVFELWMNSKNIDSSYKKIMANMSEQEINIAFNENPIVMGTAGYRAKVGPGNHYYNEYTYYQLAVGYAKYIKQTYSLKSCHKVLIVHDNRLNGDYYSLVCAFALLENGIQPIFNTNNQLLPTPISSYLVPKLDCVGCINITASHNPKEYNGFKCYDHTGSQLLPDDSKLIIDLMPSYQDAINTKINLVNLKIEYFDSKLIDEYFNDIKSMLFTSDFNTNRKIKLVYSSMHGTASYYMTNFLNSLGYECIDVALQNYPDPNFTHASVCNPEDPNALKLAIEIADKNDIKIVLASDPDADRLAIAIKKNNKWIYLNGNEAGIIETFYRLKQLENDSREKIVISTYISTNLIDRIVNQYNGKVIRTATGFKWIGNQINHLNFNQQVYVNGFEEAIGALPTSLNRDKDSFQTAVLILDIISYYYNKNLDLIDILETIIYPQFGHWFGSTTSILIDGSDWQSKANEYMNKLMSFNLDQILDRRVCSVSYNQLGSCIEIHLENDSWVKFRLSGTEPKFKIYVNLYELNDKKEIDYSITLKLKNECQKIIEYFKNYLHIND